MNGHVYLVCACKRRAESVHRLRKIGLHKIQLFVHVLGVAGL